jgi:protein TonB
MSTNPFPAASKAILATAATLLLAACGQSDPAAVAPRPESSVPVPADASQDASDPVRELRSRAIVAFRDGRLFEPAGDNALEHYVAVLAIEPDDPSAREALSDLFPLALARAEAAADQGALDESRRILDLLERAIAGSAAVAALRQRLDRALETSAPPPPMAPEAATRVAPATAPATASVTIEGEVTSAVGPGPVDAPASVETGVQPDAVASAPREAARREGPDDAGDDARVAVATEAEAPAERAASVHAAEPAVSRTPTPSAPRLVERVAPEYPAVARQRRIEGWVELEYVVGADGRVIDVRVLDSHPTRVFEAAAERALRRWRFEPAVGEGGAPQPTVGRTRIDFTLG